MGMAFVLGNGLSRQPVDLNVLAANAPVYGCNALYREFTPTVLVSTDRPIAERIQHSGYPIKNKFYTRRPIEGLGAHRIPQKYYGFSSGPVAVGLAAFDGHSVIYLLGFDMGATSANRFNNCYADTEFYKSSRDSPTYTGNWVRQIATICQDFANTQFIRVCGDLTAEIAELKGLRNLGHMPVAEFLNRLTVTKTL